MKRLTFAYAAALFLLSHYSALAQQVQQVKNSAVLNMPGIYIMTRQTIDSGKGVEAVNGQQWKVFTDKYVMYARRRSETDSSAAFGVGTYKVENGKVIENMFYGAAGPSDNRFELDVNKLTDGYTQVINFPGNRRFILTENYERTDRKLASPLDGAWSIEKRTNVDKNGKSNTILSTETAKQFKFYNSGHFMWASSWKEDGSDKWSSAYGYGTFDNTAPDEITETNVSSTFGRELNGQPVKLKIKFTGKDMYEQTITWPDGTKMIELYKRLK
jgi:hypothetical protein